MASVSFGKMSHEDRAIIEIATVRAAVERIRMIEAALESDARPRVWRRWEYVQEQPGEPARRTGAAEAALAFGIAKRAHGRAARGSTRSL